MEHAVAPVYAWLLAAVAVLFGVAGLTWLVWGLASAVLSAKLWPFAGRQRGR